MSVSQRLLHRLAPRTARRAEAESRRWRLVCPAGHKLDLWEQGGIRYRGNWLKPAPRHCPRCGRVRAMAIRRVR